MELKELQSFIKSSTIPVIREKATTFLGISKQPHYENVWSNIYAFFFKVSGEHHLKDLFIKSLVQLINKKVNQEYSFSNRFNIETEYSTKKNGRIDLLLFTNGEAIIIENKVYHYLNNDLNDYWNSIKQPQKQGVVLSLKKISKTGNENFINITHLELMQCVMGNLSVYFSEANEKYLIYLKDFYQNVINMSNPIESESLRFFYQYQKEINEINNVRKSVTNHIKSQIELACDQTDINLTLSKPGGDNEDKYRYYLSKANPNLMFTIFFSKLIWANRELLIIVELKNELLDKKDKLLNIKFSDEEEELIKKDFYTRKERWAHFAFKSYQLSENEIADLSSSVVKIIDDSPISSIFKKIEAALVEKK